MTELHQRIQPNQKIVDTESKGVTQFRVKARQGDRKRSLGIQRVREIQGVDFVFDLAKLEDDLGAFLIRVVVPCHQLLEEVEENGGQGRGIRFSNKIRMSFCLAKNSR